MPKIQIGKKHCINMIVGVLCIYIIYIPTALYHQKLIKHSYTNRITGKIEKFDNPLGLVIFSSFIVWIIAKLYNTVYFKEQLPSLPTKNTFICGLNIALASVLSTEAIMLTSFPAVMMFKSGNLLMVILIGIFCSRVKDKTLKLTYKKILITIVVTAGVFIFQFFDPQTRDRQFKAEVLGIVCLTVTLFLDGFLPDLQAQMKASYKPEPTKMLEQINKWLFIITITFGIVTTRCFDGVAFLWEHFQFTFDIIIWSLLSVLGQFFIYRMIKHFKQHIVPFVISTRKIITIFTSIIFYGHQTNWIQIMGIVIVFVSVAIEFLIEMHAQTKREQLLKNKSIRVPTLSQSIQEQRERKEERLVMNKTQVEQQK